MKQHKWAKEIKAWADGAEIEYRLVGFKIWGLIISPEWDEDMFEYRIKPQPKEPQHLKVYGWLENQNISFDENMGYPYIGKIKLEVDD